MTDSWAGRRYVRPHGAADRPDQDGRSDCAGRHRLPSGGFGIPCARIRVLGDL